MGTAIRFINWIKTNEVWGSSGVETWQNGAYAPRIPE